MLNAPDLSGYDLEELSAGLLLLAQRQDRCLRQANRIAEANGNPGLTADIDSLDRDAATAAKAHRLVSELRRSAGGAQDRPSALSARTRVAVTVAPRPGPYARLMAFLGRGAPDSSQTDPRP